VALIRYIRTMGLAAPIFLGSDQREGPPDGEPRPARHLSAVESDSPGESWQSRIISVLVVEDDAAMQLLVSYNLQAAGFDIATASTGTEALERLAQEKPDLVLLDVMLPDMGGFEVADRIGAIPVVFMSAKASEGDFRRGREAGAMDYVTKPFDPIHLPTRLREDLVELDRGGSAEHVWTLRFGSKR
jgi:CheY-like chemotaxis protein